MDITGDKAALRRIFAAARKAIPPETRQKYDRAIVSSIAELKCFQEAEIIAAFIPLGAEPDLSPLFSAKVLLLPRFVQETGVYELACVENIRRDLLPGKYGIPEPRPEIPAFSGEIAASRVLFLTPAVSCDRHGTRLGRGGGFYDRLLKDVKIPPVAVIYSCQLSDSPLPGTLHDVKMGTVVTEREVIIC